MRFGKLFILIFVYLVLVSGLVEVTYLVCNGSCPANGEHELILSLDAYQDSHFTSTWDQLMHRVQVQPFNFIALVFFIMAVIHTFFSHSFTKMADELVDKHISEHTPVETFAVESVRFLGEVEVVFGLWVIPLMAAMTYFYNWETAIRYLEGRSYTEPLFVVVIMTIASTAPILKLAEDAMRGVAKLGKGSVKAWWWAILLIGPLSGSFITEPAAMTISAILLGKQFYRLKPRTTFAYATLGLLFTNISVGGVLTNFAAPPVLMVSRRWGWDIDHMFFHFGLKAAVGILLANAVYYFWFRKEFAELEERRRILPKEPAQGNGHSIPFWVSFVHVIFLAWIVAHVHHPIIFMGSFLLFLGFYRATHPSQERLRLSTPILVGFFLAGLVVHGSLQAWWIAPILENASREALMALATVLTAFNDNAEITFLATLIPSFDSVMKYAVVAGAVTGGGLTVIANAPNPSGQAILGKHFEHGVSPLGLFLGAAIPTIIMGLSFYLWHTV